MKCNSNHIKFCPLISIPFSYTFLAISHFIRRVWRSWSHERGKFMLLLNIRCIIASSSWCTLLFVFTKVLFNSVCTGLSPETRRLSRRLLKMVGSLLTQFTDIYYTQRRLLPADLKVIFTGEPHRICGFVLLGRYGET